MNSGSNEAVRPKTKIYAWGANVSGQLGTSDLVDELAQPSLTIEFDEDIVAIEAGVHSVYAVCADGTVYAWGENSEGQLGDGTRVSRSTPRKIAGLRDVVAVAAWDAAYALKSDGTVWTWGAPSAEQIRNPLLARQVLGSLVPTPMGKLTNIVAIAASAHAGYALRSDGGIHSWGGFEYGELGAPPTNVDNAFSPSWVQRANSGGGKLDPTGKSGMERLVAIGGRVASEPVRDAKAIAAGFLSAYGLAHDGTVWSWGHNDFGQLGWGELTTTPAGHQIQVELAQGVVFPKWPGADKVRNLTGVVALASKGLTAYGLREDGTVWAWGANDLGQLGRGRIRPPGADGSLDCSISAEQVPDLAGVKAISSMGDTVFAVHADGRVTAWGDGRNNETGVGTPGIQHRPTAVPGLAGVRAVAPGIDFAVAVVPKLAPVTVRETDRKGSGGCYIATAVYGSYDAPPVITLRRFRDEYLAGSALGRAFIWLYYWASPSVAVRLSGAPVVSAAVRRVLDAVVTILNTRAK